MEDLDTRLIFNSENGQVLPFVSKEVANGDHPVKIGSGIVTALLSSGGSSRVYEIWNPELEVIRAVKILHPDHSKEAEERFRTEIKITAKLHHPNIIEIYTVGQWNNLPYIEMEKINGFTLEEIIAHAGALPLGVVTSIAIMVGRALNYAHNQSYIIYGKEYKGIIHRDLKPSNIMVTKSGIVKLMDFGIAKPVMAPVYTTENVVVGTMQYLAPEQLNNEEVTPRSDVYSLGAVLYEMLSGNQAFPERIIGKLVADKVKGVYIPLHYYRREIPDALIKLIHKCLECDPAKRPKSAFEFLGVLDKIHSRLTKESPEKVISNFMQSDWATKKVVVQIGKQVRLLPIVLWSVTAILALFSAVIVTLNINILDYLKFSDNLKNNVDLKIIQNGSQPKTETPSKIELPSTVTNITTNPQQIRSATYPIQKQQINQISRGPKLKPEKQHPAFGARTPSSLGEILKPTEAVKSSPVKNELHNKGTLLLDKLKQEYGTNKIETILSAEIEAKRFVNAKEIWENLPAEFKTSISGAIFRIRILKGIGAKQELANFLTASNIADGEFYLEKASYYFDIKEFILADRVLSNASVMPVRYMDQNIFRQKILLLKALCKTAIFEQDINSETKKNAMESWYELKYMFRASPDNEYYLKADSQMRRIEKKYAEFQQMR